MGARIANIVLGVWLFISAFLWPHTYTQMTNSWILGVLCVVFALVALSAPPARYLNTALAVWLFISAFAFTANSQGTVWNNAIVAVLIFFFSMVPSGAAMLPTTRPPRTA